MPPSVPPSRPPHCTFTPCAPERIAEALAAEAAAVRARADDEHASANANIEPPDSDDGPDEAKEYGMIDNVISSRGEIVSEEGLAKR